MVSLIDRERELDALETIQGQALKHFKKDPNCPPMVISNDSFSEYFAMRKELTAIRGLKKGVTFVSIGGRKEAVISRFWGE
jgi:hypothetical protein